MERDALTAGSAQDVFGVASLTPVEATLLCSAVAAILAIWGIVTQRIVARRRATLDHVTRVDTDVDLIEARDQFAELSKADGGLARWAAPQHLGSPEVRAIRLILNENERLAIGIQFGILDIAFIKRHSQGPILRDWELASPFVMALRAKTGRQALFHEFEDLVDKLRTDRLPRRSHWAKLWF